MSNFDRAVKALNDVDEAIDHLADNEAYVTALEAAGLLAPELPGPEDEWESEYPGVPAQNGARNADSPSDCSRHSRSL